MIAYTIFCWGCACKYDKQTRYCAWEGLEFRLKEVKAERRIERKRKRKRGEEKGMRCAKRAVVVMATRRKNTLKGRFVEF
jgi:hypothetical protein